MSAKGQKRTSQKERPPCGGLSEFRSVSLDHAARAAAFFFLHQPSRPNPPRPLAKSGSAAGSGVSEPIETARRFTSEKLSKVSSPPEVGTSVKKFAMLVGAPLNEFELCKSAK